MKQIYLLLFFFSINCFSQDEFITIWNSETAAPANSIYIPIIQNDSSFFYTWQPVDENFTPLAPFNTETEVSPNVQNLTITFPTPGLYRLKIETNSSNFSIKQLDSNYYSEDLLRIEQWGTINWSSFNKAFQNAIFLDITATDIPNLSNVTDVSYMFSNCSSLVFNNSINNWETINIQNFEGMFANAQLFNKPIGNWDMINATRLTLMFMGANSFDQDIEFWDVRNVTNFRGTFHYNDSFNHPLDRWNVIKGDTLSHMFCGTLKFNQPLNSWNVNNAINMEWIFNGANKFNQSLSNWKLNSVVEAENFFNFSGMNCINFTSTILGWFDNPNLVNNLEIGIENMKHNSVLNPVLNWLTTTKNWTLAGTLTELENCSLTNDDFQKIETKIYPNPTHDILNIEGIEVYKIEVYSTLGQLVNTYTNSNTISIGHLATGNYLLKINDNIIKYVIKK